MIVPPAPLVLAQNAYTNIKNKKHRRPKLQEMWIECQCLWWGWWADMLLAVRGVEFLESVENEWWNDTILEQYPQARFPWETQGELAALCKSTVLPEEPKPEQPRLF